MTPKIITKMTAKWPQKWHQNDTKMNTKWHQNYTKNDCKNEGKVTPKMTPKIIQNDTKMIPKWHKMGTKLIPKLHQKWGRHPKNLKLSKKNQNFWAEPAPNRRGSDFFLPDFAKKNPFDRVWRGPDPENPQNLVKFRPKSSQTPKRASPAHALGPEGAGLATSKHTALSP